MALENYFKPWSEADIEYLKDNYGKVPTVQIAEKLGRTKSTVYYYAQKNKFSKTYELWTDKDIELFKDLYRKTPNNVLCEMFNKTLAEIHKKASYIGLKKDKEFKDTNRNPVGLLNHKVHRGWSEEEMKILEELYPTTNTREIPLSRSLQAIRKKARKMNIKKSDEFVRDNFLRLKRKVCNYIWGGK